MESFLKAVIAEAQRGMLEGPYPNRLGSRHLRFYATKRAYSVQR